MQKLSCLFYHNFLLNKECCIQFEPRYEKTGILHMRKQRRRSVNAKLISAFVFATRVVRSLYHLNSKFQASSHLLWLYRPVCVGPGRKPRRPVFSERGSFSAKKQHCFLSACCRFYSYITKPRPCNIQQYFTAVKMFIFR